MSTDIYAIPGTLGGAVNEVLAWLREHPHRDYLDACFAVVAAPPQPGQYRSSSASMFSTSRWPELLEAVKISLAKQEAGAHNNSALKEDT